MESILRIRKAYFAVCFALVFAFGLNAKAEKKFSLNDLPSKTLLNAKPASLTELKGKIVLVDFWASWCEPCKESLPFYQSLKEKDKNIEVILVNEDSDSKDGEKFLKESKISLASRFDTDSSLAKAWELEAIPMLFIFDKTGNLAKSIRGVSKAKEKDLLKTIDELKLK